MKIQNKVAIVTGAGSGMGKAIATLFAREGAKVIAADIVLETVNAVVAEIVAEGGSAKAIIANVAKEKDVQNMVDEAVGTYGTLDILVNNAGIMDNFVPAAEVTDELWEKVFAVNVTGPMRAIRKALPIFIEKNPALLLISLPQAGSLVPGQERHIQLQNMLLSD